MRPTASRWANPRKIVRDLCTPKIVSLINITVFTVILLQAGASIMPRRLRIAYFAHSITSDWNNGNAHFLRGLIRSLGLMGHSVTCWEEENGWSRGELLRSEQKGQEAIEHFHREFADVHVAHYQVELESLRRILQQVDIAIVHEWKLSRVGRVAFCSRCSPAGPAAVPRHASPRLQFS